MILIERFNGREDYDQIRQLFRDPADLPATFDQWREQALKSVRKMKKGGIFFREIVIDAREFTAWCQTNAARHYRLAIDTFKALKYQAEDTKNTR